jgi:sigma-B regulation protein RsbU (phosphoserine phosphatase)
MTTASQLDAGLQAQLELASQIQLSLLPERRCCLSDWEIAFSYEPAGFVSGDYVDLIPSGAGEFYFALGDVSGKGVAASILMSHLHATLRTLLPSRQTIAEVLGMASSTFCHSTLPAQFATLVLGKADRLGNLELVNAGHTPVILVENRTVRLIPGTSLPLGMFCTTEFLTTEHHVSPGSTLLLYSDGITESTNNAGLEFDLARVAQGLVLEKSLSAPEILDAIHRSIVEHTDGAQLSDDRTMLALRWLSKGL